MGGHQSTEPVIQKTPDKIEEIDQLIEWMKHAPESHEFRLDFENNKNLNIKVLQQYREKLRNEYSEGSSKFSHRIAVVDPLPATATEKFFLQLRNFFESGNVICQKCEVGMISDDTFDPFILICNNHSRLETDFNNSISMVNPVLFKKVIVIVLHCKEERQLPKISSKEQLNQYDFIDIVDMAFNANTNSIYSCNINAKAKIQLTSLRYKFEAVTSLSASTDEETSQPASTNEETRQSASTDEEYVCIDHGQLQTTEAINKGNLSETEKPEVDYS